MTCLQPIIAWQKRFADLKQSPQDYYRDKKLKFKKPGNRIIKNYQEIKIACGHCLGCRLDHANYWATRIMLEAKRHKKNCFVTLTYNNEKLPQRNGHMTLCKKDLQDFIKRLRWHVKEKILYFACGEYGDTTYRPHYHIIIFNYEPKDLQPIIASQTGNAMFTSPKLEKIWGNGYIAIEELNYKTACYTARYVQKKAGVKPNRRYATQEFEYTEKIDERTGKPFMRLQQHFKTEKYDWLGREKEFLVMSKKPALGLTYWKEHEKEIKKNGGIWINIDGHPHLKAIPRYFKKQWEKSDIWGFVYGNFKITEQVKKNLEEQKNKINAKDPEKKLTEYQNSSLLNKAQWLKRDEI